MRVAVVDGQGGGIGKLITEKLRKALGERIEIIALGTNAMAAALMLKAGADEGASGENAVCTTVKSVEAILGPLAIVMANAMLGEITPCMAAAIAGAEAEKILMPLNKFNVTIVGLYSEPLPHLVDLMVQRVEKKMETPKKNRPACGAAVPAAESRSRKSEVRIVKGIPDVSFPV